MDDATLGLAAVAGLVLTAGAILRDTRHPVGPLHHAGDTTGNDGTVMSHGAGLPYVRRRHPSQRTRTAPASVPLRDDPARVLAIRPHIRRVASAAEGDARRSKGRPRAETRRR